MEEFAAIYNFSTTVSEFEMMLRTCNKSYFYPSTVLQQIYSVMEGFLVVVSAVLNLTIIVVISSNRRLHTVPNVFITSLAFSELISSSTYSISELVILGQTSTCNLSHSFRCARLFMIDLGFFSILGNHLIISTERWFYIARPFLHQRIVTRRSTICCVVLVWVVSAVSNVNMVVKSCWILSVSQGINAGLIGPIVHFSLCLLMITIYLHITYLTRRAIRNINKTRPMAVSNNEQGANTTVATIKSVWKTTRMLVTVFGVFFIFLSPSMIGNLYTYSKDLNFYSTITGIVLEMTWSMQCCLNFFIYAFQDKAFRDVLKKGFDTVRQHIHRQFLKTGRSTLNSAQN